MSQTNYFQTKKNNNNISVQQGRSVSADLFSESSEEKEEEEHVHITAPRAEGNNLLVFKSNRFLLTSTSGMIADIELRITMLLEEFVIRGGAIFRLRNSILWQNFELDPDQTLTMRKNNDDVIFRQISFNQTRSRHRFSIILYVLAEVHRQLFLGDCCTSRELYYRDTMLTCSQAIVNNAVRDVCNMMRTAPWMLGILASGKGLIAGSLRIFMNNGDVLDCQAYSGATLIPHDFFNIDHFETNAAFVLLVEKDTVFKKILSQNFFGLLDDEIIAITGKGYPDFGTRFIVHRLYSECRLPIYILVDPDPFGIEIMLVYRYGSRSMSHCSDQLACPYIRWIGIHPSEINVMDIPSVPFNRKDHQKSAEILQRNYVSSEVKRELQILQENKKKTEIEEMSSFALYFLLHDYIPTKIRRSLWI